jgi:hypothetical protein
MINRILHAGLMFLLAISLNARAQDVYRFERMWPTIQQNWHALGLVVGTDDRGNVYHKSVVNEGISIYNTDGVFVTSWTFDMDTPPGTRSYIVTMGLDKNIYVVGTYTTDTHGGYAGFLEKYSLDGRRIPWNGSTSSIIDPSAVRIDTDGQIYISDHVDQVRKLAADGSLIYDAFFDNEVSFTGYNDDFTIDDNGRLYVPEPENDRILLFGADGSLIGPWPEGGTADLANPYSVVVEPAGTLLIRDDPVPNNRPGDSRLRRFSPDGTVLLDLTAVTSGTDDDDAFAADSSGCIYFDDGRKYSPAGVTLAHWHTEIGNRRETTFHPYEFAIHPDGDAFIFHRDIANIPDDPSRYDNHIKVYSRNGMFRSRWAGDWGTPNQAYDNAILNIDITFDNLGNLYTCDVPVQLGNGRIQKFLPDGTLLNEWHPFQTLYLGPFRIGESASATSVSIAVDDTGSIYAAVNDYYHSHEFDNIPPFSMFDVLISSRIDKIASDGTFVGHLIQYNDALPHSFYGSAVEFGFGGVAVDPAGKLFVMKNRWIGASVLQVYNGVGQLTTERALPPDIGNENHFDFLAGDVALDALGNAYVLNPFVNSVVRTASTGQQFEFGQYGGEPGKLLEPRDIACDDSGNLYLLDAYRLQKFRPFGVESNQKSIVVAAGYRYPANTLWRQTQLCANFAYRALVYQGYSRDKIFYLNANPELDLDQSGSFMFQGAGSIFGYDDVDADSTKVNLQTAITQWASGADDLVVYLVGDGGENGIRLNRNEVLSPQELAGWLNQVQGSLQGPLTVVIDSGQSGQFVSALQGEGRVVVASAGADESAHFLSTGALSFSNYFWVDVFSGKTVLESFEHAAEGVGGLIDLQTPQLGDSGKALAGQIYIGQGTEIGFDAPVIGSVPPPQNISGTSYAELIVDPVTDTQGVARVWAVIQPPDWQSNGDTVLTLPSFELFPDPANLVRWSGSYDGFTQPGTYTIGIYARDTQGNPSLPVTTSVTITDASSRKGLIVACGAKTDSLWPAFQTCSDAAYRALRAKGYSDDDIRYLSANDKDGVDGSNHWTSIEAAFTSWAVTNTSDLLVYVIGNANPNHLLLGGSETLSIAQLDAWLDALQVASPVKITLVLDAPYSNSFIPQMVPLSDSERIVMVSGGNTGRSAFLADGQVTYSNFFWQLIAIGESLEQADRFANAALAFLPDAPVSAIDDNGNGLTNETSDGNKASATRPGSDIEYARSEPLIGSAVPAQTLYQAESATLWVDQVSSVNNIKRVFAVIVPPVEAKIKATGVIAGFPVAELADAGNGRFEADYDGFNVEGDYTVAIFAQSENGPLSIPAVTTVTYLDEAAPLENPLDINGDGVVNAVDVQLVTNAALGIAIAFPADVNGDNTVNAVDVQLVTNAALALNQRT